MHRYCNVPVGKYTYGFEGYCENAENIESIGAFCSIAENVSLARSNHPLKCITTHPIIYLKQFGMLEEDRTELEIIKKLKIGHDVWIGRDVTILPGVKIGNGAVIGAGAVINKDIPDYAIAVGVPAKVIKYRFNDEKIKKLNNIKWWNWSDTQIRNNIDLLINSKDFFEQEDFHP